MEKLPAFSPCMVRLGYITVDRYNQLRRKHQAIGYGSKQRVEYVVITNAVIRESIPSGTLHTTYNEDLGNGDHLPMLKRVINGQYRKWHPDLTFDDVRAGRVIPESVQRNQRCLTPSSATA